MEILKSTLDVFRLLRLKKKVLRYLTLSPSLNSLPPKCVTLDKEIKMFVVYISRLARTCTYSSSYTHAYALVYIYLAEPINPKV